MPLTEEEKRWLEQTLGQRGVAPPLTSPLPGTLPPTVPRVTQPYPTSLTRGGLKIAIPPPQEAVEQSLVQEAHREGVLEKAKARAKGEVEFEEVLASVGTAFDLLDKVPPPETQTRGFISRLARNPSAKWLGTEPELNEFNTFASSILGQLAKVVSREGGRLTDQDIGRVAGLLLQMPFLPIEGRRRRAETINNIVQRKGFSPLIDLERFGAQQGDDRYLAEARRRGLLP